MPFFAPQSYATALPRFSVHFLAVTFHRCAILALLCFSADILIQSSHFYAAAFPLSAFALLLVSWPCHSHSHHFRSFRSNSFAFLLSAIPSHLLAIQSLSSPFHSQSALLNAVANLCDALPLRLATVHPSLCLYYTLHFPFDASSAHL